MTIAHAKHAKAPSWADRRLCCSIRLAIVDGTVDGSAYALLNVLMQEVQSRLGTIRPFSRTLTVWMFTFHFVRVAFLDQGRLLPN